ncbi:MAG: sigma-70 family RNA polymerase sigma factor [Actinobacteria bacterium]|jgi:RNA polymerase sigma-B factor|nr:MAG: sigma-70 family RNA polymerase sigma factor [Actinomycetota bacterium]
MERKGLNTVEIDLLERIKEDDDADAKERFFARYQDLLHRFAHKYHSDRLPYEDAYQLAALGLMKALRRFDPDRGVSFITFAYPTVEGELKKHYRDHLEIIRLPRPLRDLRHRINVETRAIMEEEGREPDIKKLAQRLEVGEEDIIEALAAQQRTCVYSLDSTCGEGQEEPPLSFFIGAHDPAFEEVEKELVIENALASLPLRHRQVMDLRLNQAWTQTRIARELKISQMHVSRIIRESVGMLQDRCSLQEETA